VDEVVDYVRAIKLGLNRLAELPGRTRLILETRQALIRSE
jgi:hypothetical protein